MPQLMKISPNELELIKEKMGNGDQVKRPADDFPDPISSRGATLEPLLETNSNCVWTVRGDFDLIPHVASLSNTMTIYKCPQSGVLTIFNAFRCNAQLEQEILKLGPIGHIVKLGQFHGAADAYYVRAPQFASLGAKPKLWTLPDGSVAAETTADEILSPTNLPIHNAKLYNMEGHPFPEGVLTVPCGNGQHLLIATDALIHIPDVSIVSYMGRFIFYMMGLALQASPNVPQPAALWFKNTVKCMGEDCVTQWYQQIAAMEWTYFIGGHGVYARNVNHQDMIAAMEKQLPSKQQETESKVPDDDSKGIATWWLVVPISLSVLLYYGRKSTK